MVNFLKKFLPIVLVLWPIFKTVFTWLSGVDFVITRSKDPDWLGDVMAFLLNPSPAFNLAIFVLGVSWLAFLVWQSRKQPSPPAVSVSSPEWKTARETMLQGKHRFGFEDPHIKLARAIEKSELSKRSDRNREMMQQHAKSLYLNEQQEKRLRLLALRADGVQLHNREVLTEQYADWHLHFEGWHERTLTAAEALDPELKARLAPLGDFMWRDVGVWVSPQHRLERNMILEIINRIEKYLDGNPLS